MIILKIGDKRWNSELSFKNVHELEKVIYYLAFLWMLGLKINDKQWISQWSFKIKKQLPFHGIIYFYDQCGSDKRVFLMIFRSGETCAAWTFSDGIVRIDLQQYAIICPETVLLAEKA